MADECRLSFGAEGPAWHCRAEAAEAKLAEVRETIATFLAHYGHSELPSFKVALDLAHGVQQVLDRKGPDDA